MNYKNTFILKRVRTISEGTKNISPFLDSVSYLESSYMSYPCPDSLPQPLLYLSLLASCLLYSFRSQNWPGETH